MEFAWRNSSDASRASVSSIATCPKLYAFAKYTSPDHSKLNDQLKELAAKKGIALSTEADPKHQKMIDHLSGLSGAEFDKAFAMQVVRDHKKEIAMYKKAASNTEDTELSDYAKNALPTLQEHLRTVQQWAPEASAGGALEEPSGAEKKVDSSQSPDASKSESPK